jgi:hypothetical protein
LAWSTLSNISLSLGVADDVLERQCLAGGGPRNVRLEALRDRKPVRLRRRLRRRVEFPQVVLQQFIQRERQG